jgi:Zn-dependent peptidase ImmA (M78 family)
LQVTGFPATIGAVPGPVTDVRAGVVRGRYHQRFGGVALPVPVEAIAEDLLGLVVDDAGDLDASGMLVPAERRIYLNAAESPQRRRFTLAHEVGHWVCQVLAGHAAPVYCRAVDLLPEADRALEREANVFAAELLMPEQEVRASWAGSILECAKRFGVSEEAIEWRLYNLGLVHDHP